VVSELSYTRLSVQIRTEALTGATDVSKVHDAEFAQGAHDFASDLVGHVQLGQRHVRRAEQRILLCRHVDCRWFTETGGRG
jgi:hypothetical protein